MTDPYKALQVVPTADQEVVRDADARAQLDRARLRKYDYEATPTGNGEATTPPPPRASSAGMQLDQGRYAGWTLRDIATHDPDYLRWLSRHVSGLRYRPEIVRILAARGVAAA